MTPYRLKRRVGPASSHPIHTGKMEDASMVWPLIPVKFRDALPHPQPMKAILPASTTTTPAVIASIQVRSADFCPASQSSAVISASIGSMMPAAPRWVITSQIAEG